MPAKSKAQQQAMGIALSAQRGLIPRSKLRGPSRKMMNMTEQQLSDFAKGPTKGKPLHVPKKFYGGGLGQGLGQLLGSMQGVAPSQGPGSPAGFGQSQTALQIMQPRLGPWSQPASLGQGPDLPTAVPGATTLHPGAPMAKGGVAKKWWGGPLAGFAPWQSQGKGLSSMMSGFQRPPMTATVAPAMPSLSALMAKPANGWQGPMGSYARGGELPKPKPPKSKIDLPFLNTVPPRQPPPFNPNRLPNVPSPEEKKLQHMPGPTFAGHLDSDVPGRTDQLPISVSAGSYVIPADVISGIGQGNTRAGVKMLEELLAAYKPSSAVNDNVPGGVGRGGVRTPGVYPKQGAAIGPEGIDIGIGKYTDSTSTKGGSGPFNMPRVLDPANEYADGGETEGIPIVAAGGEYVISPGVVVALGEGDELKGHSILDKMVLSIRGATAKRLSKLPPPRRD